MFGMFAPVLAEAERIRGAAIAAAPSEAALRKLRLFNDFIGYLQRCHGFGNYYNTLLQQR